MTGDCDRPSPIRPTDGWSSPYPGVDPALEPAHPAAVQPLPSSPWLPPVSLVRLGEHPAHRRRNGILRSLRARTYLLFGIAVAAGIPLVLGWADLTANGVHNGLRTGLPPAYANPVSEPSQRTTIPTPDPTRTPDPPAPRPTPASPSPRPAVPDPVGSAPDPSPTAPEAPGPPTVPLVPTIYLSIEAEDAEWYGTAAARELAGASGGTVVTGLGGGTANMVRFTNVTVPAAGTYTVTLHYVADHQMVGSLVVNGERQMLVFPASGQMPGTIGTQSVRLSLTDGVNTIEFGRWHLPVPDLDRIVITP